MKSKIFTVAAILILIFSVSAFAKYESGTTVDQLVLSGETTPYKRVTFVLLNSDNMECGSLEETVEKYNSNVNNGIVMTTSEIFRFDSVNADSEGKWKYTIDMTGSDIDGRNMEAEDYKANYTLISNAGEPEFIVYASIAYRKAIIPNLKQKSEADDEGESLASAITDSIDFITDGKDYKKLSDKTRVALMSKELISGLDPEADSSIGMLKKAIDEATLVESVAEGLVTDFSDVMSIVEYDLENEGYITDEGKVATVANIRAYKNYANTDEYKNFAKKQFSIQLFNNNVNKTGEKLAEVLSEVNEFIGLDLSAFNILSTSNKAYVARQLANCNCTDKDAMQTMLYTLISSVNATGNNVGGGSGGGSGKGGSSASSAVANIGTGVSSEYIQAHKYIYSDMELAPWSSDAILYLAEKGIVNGYADGTFKPLNNITRAEFVKLVVETFYTGEQAEFSCPLSDVSEADWYGKYVNIAYDKGIISGDNFGKFNPDAPITRQDMAVIIYNAATKAKLFDTTEVKEKFADDDSVSDYAKDAVYCLKNNKIINGVGNNLFAPVENANRASAAQIIYSLMSEYDK